MASASIEDSRRIQQILRNRQTRGSPSLNTEEEPTVEKLRVSRSAHKANDSRRKKERAARYSVKKEPAFGGEGSIGSDSKVKEPDLPESTNTTTFSLEEPVRPSNGMVFPYNVTLQALRTYHNENSHLVLPRRFLVPESSDYPVIWHGVDLAGTVYNMRWWQNHVKQRPDRVNELNDIGFVWERLQPEWNLILEALIVYRGVNGDLLVPSNFTVPYEDQQWPKACWGIALGSAVFDCSPRK